MKKKLTKYNKFIDSHYHMHIKNNIGCHTVNNKQKIIAIITIKQ